MTARLLALAFALLLAACDPKPPKPSTAAAGEPVAAFVRAAPAGR